MSKLNNLLSHNINKNVIFDTTFDTHIFNTYACTRTHMQIQLYIYIYIY